MYVRIIEGKGVSFGDQGGPLIKENNPGDADDVLVGVLSYAVGHADKGKPSVYTRVSTALEKAYSPVALRFVLYMPSYSPVTPQLAQYMPA
ncbi:Peptidase S1, PA clan [Phytophthora cactorum]|nr:Peptidase S1, PA clan [Phytophthora cactorum]